MPDAPVTPTGMRTEIVCAGRPQLDGVATATRGSAIELYTSGLENCSRLTHQCTDGSSGWDSGRYGAKFAKTFHSELLVNGRDGDGAGVRYT